MDYVSQGKIDDGLTSQGIDRNNLRFSSYKQGQALIAEYNLKTSVDGSLIQSKSVGESKSYDADFIKRSDNIVLQNRMAYELERANDLFADKFIVTDADESAKYLKIYKQFQEQK